jgi:hypothetical protein
MDAPLVEDEWFPLSRRMAVPQQAVNQRASPPRIT